MKNLKKLGNRPSRKMQLYINRDPQVGGRLGEMDQKRKDVYIHFENNKESY